MSNDNLAVATIMFITSISFCYFIYKYWGKSMIPFLILLYYSLSLGAFLGISNENNIISPFVNLYLDFNDRYYQLYEYSLGLFVILFLGYILKSVFIDPFLNKN